MTNCDSMNSSCACLVLVALPKDQVRKFENGMVREKPTLGGYANGEYLGCAEKILLLEGGGSWWEQVTMALLKFDQLDKAQLWFHSSVTLKQEEFLEKCQIVIAPIRAALHPHWDPKSVWLVHWISGIAFQDVFVNQYLPKEESDSVQHCGIPLVVNTNQLLCVRGQLPMEYLTVSLWPSEKQFHTWFSADISQGLHELRQQVAVSSLLLLVSMKL